MVAADHGWAIMTPLSIFEMAPVLDRVRCLPFPGPYFSRTVVVAVLLGENERLAEQIARISSKLLLEFHVPEILARLDWLQARTDPQSHTITISYDH